MGNNASEAGRYSSCTPTCSSFKRQKKKETSNILGTSSIEKRLEDKFQTNVNKMTGYKLLFFIEEFIIKIYY